MGFTGKDPKDTYLAVLNLGDANEVLHATTPQAVLDAAGNASLLELSQSVVEFTGIMVADVASGIVMETGIDFTSDAVITDILKDKTDNAVGIHFTAGDPEGSLAASVGSLALRRDGSAGATLYVKETGTGITGWSTYDLIATFLDLSDTPGTYTANKWLQVNAGGTALEWVDAPIGAFTALSDTPASYAGEGGKTLRVNAAPDGIEFVDSDFLSLDDTPSSYTGGGIVVVNAAGTALAEALSAADHGDVIFHGSVGWEVLTPGTSGQLLTTQGASADPQWTTITVSGLPAGSDQGDLLYFDGADWQAFGVGTAGQVLTTQGAGFDPTWELGLPSSPAQGNVIYFNGTSWANLAVGVDGQFLKTQGAAADPVWADVDAFPASPNQGEIVYYNGAAWANLGVGTDGQFLKTQGAAANPTWADVDAFPASPNQGEIVYYTGTAWANLGVGTDGQFLKTQGAAADPVWADIAGDVLDLDDTPSNYSSDGDIVYTNGTDAWTYQSIAFFVNEKLANPFPSEGQVIKADAGGTGWFDNDFLGLSDTPDEYTDEARGILGCNTGEDSLEFYASFPDDGCLFRFNDTSGNWESWIAGGTDGQMIYMAWSKWEALAPGSQDQFLTMVTSDTPGWVDLPEELPAGSQGEVLYYDGFGWEALGVGTDGQFLKTQGAAADPVWADAPTELPSGTQGDVLYYDGADWAALGVGTDGQLLKTQGAAANPVWVTPTFAALDDTVITTPAQGEVLYYDGSDWVNLGVGTDGQFLKTQGAAANPVWADAPTELPASPNQGEVIYYNGAAWVVLGVGTDGQLLKTQGAAANPVWVTPTFADLDDTVMTTPAQGEVLYFDGSDWVNLAVGTDGQLLKTQGAAANPIWVTPTFADLDDTVMTTPAQGEVLYYDGSDWVNLGVGTDGQFLKTQGAAANPAWADTAEDFTDLGDTPANYTSADNKVVKVNSTPDGLEYGPRFLSGTGSPESAVTADVGDFYTRTDGSTTDVLYVKATGTGNTGWAKVTSTTAT